MKIESFLKQNLPFYIIKRLKTLHRTVKYICHLLSVAGISENKKVTCLCCEKDFYRFLDSHRIHSEVIDRESYEQTYKNTICPKCNSFPRHRICCYYLKKNLKIITNANVLLFGAEYSIKKWLSIYKVSYKTADLFDSTSDYIIDIQDTKFTNNSWDIIIINHVLEHVIDINKTLNELKRIVKSDGFLMISVPTNYNLDTTIEDLDTTMPIKKRIKLFGQDDHFRLFGKDFLNILINTGFNVEIVDGNKYDAKYGMTIGPSKYCDNKVYICRKIDETTL